MERLTSKETRDKITNRLMSYQFNADVTITQKQFFDMYDKLLAFEDLMKKYNVEDLEHLDIMLFVLSGETKYRLKEIQQENQTLKGNWAKLKEHVEQLKGTSLHMTAHHEVQKDDKKFGEFVGRFENAKEVLIKMQELESADGEL